jgi:hypothetical protein
MAEITALMVKELRNTPENVTSPDHHGHLNSLPYHCGDF